MGLGVASLWWRRWGKGGSTARKCEGGAMEGAIAMIKIMGILTSLLELVNMPRMISVCLKLLSLITFLQVSYLQTSELFRCLGLSLLFHSCRTPALSEHHGGPERVKDSWGKIGLVLANFTAHEFEQCSTVCSRTFSVSPSLYSHLYFLEAFPDEHVFAC